MNAQNLTDLVDAEVASARTPGHKDFADACRAELTALSARAPALQAENRAQAERIAELEAAINWALGCNGDFAQRAEGQGAYWWRTELRRRAKIKYDPDAALRESGVGK